MIDFHGANLTLVCAILMKRSQECQAGTLSILKENIKWYQKTARKHRIYSSASVIDFFSDEQKKRSAEAQN